METKMIGNKIAEARKKQNISQAQLAEMLFISAQAVGKWERGESMPDIITLNKLAEILGVDLNYFSENFHDKVIENGNEETKGEQTTKLTNEKQAKKRNWDMSQGNWVDADFSGLKNLHKKFSSSNMQRSKFIGSDLAGLLLKGNHVVNCDFSDSNISESQIHGSHLVNNKFEHCLLKETDFQGSHISGCGFTGADFTQVTLKLCDFSKNTVDNVVWNHTSFIGSHLSEIVFEGILDNCYFENCSFRKVTFRNSTLINNFFKCKSLKRIQFIDCKVDKLTYAFLQNGKADLSGVTILME